MGFSRTSHSQNLENKTATTHYWPSVAIPGPGQQIGAAQAAAPLRGPCRPHARTVQTPTATAAWPPSALSSCPARQGLSHLHAHSTRLWALPGKQPPEGTGPCPGPSQDEHQTGWGPLLQGRRPMRAGCTGALAEPTGPLPKALCLQVSRAPHVTLAKCSSQACEPKDDPGEGTEEPCRPSSVPSESCALAFCSQPVWTGLH